MKQLFPKLVEECIIFWDLVEMLITISQNYDVSRKILIKNCKFSLFSARPGVTNFDNYFPVLSPQSLPTTPCYSILLSDKT